MSNNASSVDSANPKGVDVPGETVSAKACDACFRSKVKCVGRTEPPCTRCRATSQACTFDGRRKSKLNLAESRIEAVESKVGAVVDRLDSLYTSVARIEAFCRRNGAIFDAAGIGGTNPMDASLPINTSTMLSDRLTERQSFPSETHPPLSPTPLYRDTDISNAHRIDKASPPYGSAPLPTTSTLPIPANRTGALAEGDRDADDDPLVDIAKMAPLDRMVAQAEAWRNGMPSSPCRPQGDSSAVSDDPERSRKRPRSGSAAYTTRLTSNTPNTVPEGLQWTPLPSQDPVAARVCTESEGKTLLEVFFTSCHIALPIFDPTYDTWDSLQSRSPFALSAILWVASSVNIAGQSETGTPVRAQHHTESIARQTLFAADRDLPLQPDGSCADSLLGDIQALMLLSAWGDSGWRLGGHAFRVAVEAGLHRCLPCLLRDNWNPVSTGAQFASRRPLANGARVWLAICKMEYEYAFNHGRPLLIGSDPSIGLGRRFLDHPLSSRDDSRLVAACELLQGRQRNHLALGEPAPRSPSDIVAEVSLDNEYLESWYSSWIAFYDARDVVSGDYRRDALKEGKFHAQLVVNSRLLSNLAGSGNISHLAEDQRQALHKAIEAASGLVRMCVSSPSYMAHFQAVSPVSTHPFRNLRRWREDPPKHEPLSIVDVGMVFAARLLVRFATLVPQAFDLRQMGIELEALSARLETVPKRQLADRLRSVLGKARRRRIFPPISRAESPKQVDGDPRPQERASVEVMPAWNLSPAQWPADLVPDFDFGSVDALFNWGGSTDAPVAAPPELADPSVAFLDLFGEDGLPSW